ncbi:MAG: radical SAM protein, partial [Myxococcales bacterium]|nr:radical SAM protein [Myxococcales bacterium]
ERLGGPGRARAVFRALAAGADPRAELTPKASLRLAEAATFAPLPIQARAVASDGTTKLLLSVDEGHAVECVLIPERDRTTLCVSSQVGCRRGCRFCLTGTMGLVRSLGAHEIVGQVHAGLAAIAAADGALPPLRNVVLMGMGEPLDNPVAVEAALAILTDHRGFGLAPRHLTVSTVAPSPAAVRRASGWPGHLAWSLHAADDALRTALVPTARFAVAALRDAFAEVCAARGQPLFVELTLLDEVNDGDAHADAAAALLAGFPTEVRFNLLPVNPAPGLPFRPAAPERAAAFQARLIERGFFASLRRPRGQDARAACGQLAILPGAA